MLFKLEEVFKEKTKTTNNVIKDQQQFEDFTNRLIERKIIIEQDKKLFDKHIKNFPIKFDNLTNYIKEIYKLEIENLIEHKIENHNEILNNINRFLLFLRTSNNEITNNDVVQILSSLIKNNDNLDKAILNFNKSHFIITNIHDDIQKFLWEKIYQTMENQTEEFFRELDVTFNDPEDYQFKYQEKILYEYELIRVKKFHIKGNLNMPENLESKQKQLKEITCEEVLCSERNISILCYKIPNSYYDKEILENFFFQCEAGRELILSKYFQKFLGFDDISNDEFQYYFYEHIQEGVKLVPFFLSIETEITETSFFFKYLAKEILCLFRDLLNKCTQSFKFPITTDNLYYDKTKYRLYIQGIKFGPKRKSIMESHQIIEAKLLYFYGMILLNLLSLKKKELKDLIEELNKNSIDLEEFSKMQFIFDNLIKIEQILSKYLESDIVICIILECLISPYKAKVIFDEFYEKKNFYKEAIKSRKIKEDNRNNIIINEETGAQKKKSDIENLENENNRDKTTVMTHYYEDNENVEVANENAVRKSLSINMLLIHPFYSNTKLDEEFLRYLFEQNNNKME
jgi:hypothetical protein